MRKCMEEVKFLLCARTEAIWINTYEEEQVIADIQEILAANFRNWKLTVWSNTEGLKVVPIVPGEKREPADKRIREIPALFDQIRTELQADPTHDNSATVYILRDIHNLIQDPRVRRNIRDVKEYHSVRYLPIIVIAPTNEVHEEVSKLFRVIDYELPDAALIGQFVDASNVRMNKAIQEKGKEYYPVSDERKLLVINSCLGLTQNEINSLFLRSMIKYKTLDLDYIAQEKINTIRKSGMLDYKRPTTTLKDIGGHELLKEWFTEVKELFRPEAKKFGLSSPKGALLLGVPGQGKTAVAEAMAGEMNVPFISLNMAKILNRLVGSSEQNIEAALNIVKATGSCIFLIDEMEKQIG